MLELLKGLTLDKDLNTPLYLQLYEKLRVLISNGMLLAGFRLPSIRQLADSLSVNQVTVVTALKKLEDEGYVFKKPGSGTYVANIVGQPQAIAGSHAGSLIQDELYQKDELPFTGSPRITITENTINFASATPTSDLFPVDDFKVVLDEVLERDRGNAFDYQESQGYFPARESIGELLLRRDIKSHPDHIMIISGAQQGIDIISKAFLDQGDTVLTESPTYTGAIAVFKSRNAQIVEVEINEDGPNINALEYLAKKHRPKLMYTIPTFQNPTGYSYSQEKRRRLLELADKYNFYILEDDYVSDLDFDRKNYSTLKSMDTSERVIFIKSFSKIFMPGLRIGFMVIPRAIQPNMLEAKHSTDISTSALIQRAFDLYIRKGFWDKHFCYMLEIYRKRYKSMIKALEAHAPGEVSYHKPGGGLNIWLNLPKDVLVANLEKLAYLNDLVFAPGRIFYSGNPVHNLGSIRLSFASVQDGRIEEGVEKLCNIIHSLISGNGHMRVPVL